MEDLEPLYKHCRSLLLRTLAAVALYAGFLAASIRTALGGYDLKHPVTLASILFIVLTFTALPRDYKPAALMRKAQGEDATPLLNQINKLERWGMILRVSFLIGAAATLFFLPRMQ